MWNSANVGNTASIPQQQPHHFHCRNSAHHHIYASFVQQLGILATPPTRTGHSHTATSQDSVQAGTQGHICTMSLATSSLANLHTHGASSVVQTCDNTMDIGPDYVGVWDQSKFQLTDCFSGSCLKMQMCIIME